MGFDDLFTALLLIGGIGVWYFIKKRPNKKFRNISIGILAFSIVGMGIFVTIEEDSGETASANTTATSTEETTTDTSKELEASKEKASSESKEAEESKEKEIEESKEKATEESKQKAKKEAKESEESEQKEKKLEDKEEKQQKKDNEISEKINNRLEENRGFAVGEGTSDGQPNSEFEYSLAIDKVEYDVNLLRVYVNDNFLEYSKPQASEELKKVQNGAKSSIGEVEDWDTEDYQKGLPAYVYYGDTELGKSKTFSPEEFKWND